MLLFIDNIFRFVQGGSEVSALLGTNAERGRLPADPRHRNGRAAGANHLDRAGSVTSIQAIYVPADDPTDPAPATTFAFLDATTYLERRIFVRGIFPAVDPLASTSRILDPNIVGQEHLRRRPRGAADPPALPRTAGHHRDPRRRRALRRGQADRPPGAQDRELPLPADVRRRSLHRDPGPYVPIAETIRGFEEIMDGKHDDVPESAFFLKGTIDEVVEAAKK